MHNTERVYHYDSQRYCTLQRMKQCHTAVSPDEKRLSTFSGAQSSTLRKGGKYFLCHFLPANAKYFTIMFEGRILFVSARYYSFAFFLSSVISFFSVQLLPNFNLRDTNPPVCFSLHSNVAVKGILSVGSRFFWWMGWWMSRPHERAQPLGKCDVHTIGTSKNKIPNGAAGFCPSLLCFSFQLQGKLE